MALLKGHLSIFACSRIFVTFDNVIILIPFVVITYEMFSTLGDDT